MIKQYTMNEVASHCTTKDLWIVYDRKVYDMTSYLNNHPGGLAIMRQAGQDASTAIRSVTSHGMAWSFIQKTLEEHKIGELKTA